MRILDQYGNPIDTGRLAEPQISETGWLHREFERHPAKGLTPARLASIMTIAEQGDLLDQIDLADDMEERDGHIYAELSKRKGAVAALEWDLAEPPNADAKEKKLTAELREWLRDIPDFEDFLHGMMDGVLKGFALHEVLWPLDQGVRVPRFTFRPQRWFTLDARREALLLRSQTEQQPGQGDLPAVMGEQLRPLAWVVHTPRSRSGYLARASLCRVLAWPYLFKNYSTRDLAEFLEIYGLPLRVGQYPAGASDAEKRALLRAVTEIGHNAAGVIPAGMKIEFQNAAQGTQVPFLSMMQFMEAVQSKVILGQTLTASEGQHGTQALGNVHEGVMLRILKGDVRQVEGTVDTQVIARLAMLNRPGIDFKRLPKFKIDTGEAEDITAYSDSLPKLAKAGMRIKVDWAHEKLRIPMAEKGEEVLQGPPDPVAPGVLPPNDRSAVPPKGKPAADKAALAALATLLAGATAPQRDALDRLVDDALSDWRPMVAPMVAPLIAEIENALARGETLEAFAARLPELIDRMDGKPLAERLARANFIARLAGEADLEVAGDGA